ncbi:YigZ family protein [candidate division WOR-3 bacterium]|nr:YigZ family protein [candidate division WOR-3 bacterium]
MAKFVPSSSATVETLDKKSRFIAFLTPVESDEDIKKILSARKSAIKNANHHPFAFIAGAKKKYSDDGEPSGTSGKPILSCIERASLFETLIVVSRIFGGIKLGAAGLTRAYVKAASLAVSRAHLKELVSVIDYEIVCDYREFEEFKKLIGPFRIYCQDDSYTEKVRSRFSLIESDEKTFAKAFASAKNMIPQALKKGKREIYVE